MVTHIYDIHVGALEMRTVTTLSGQSSNEATLDEQMQSMLLEVVQEHVDCLSIINLNPSLWDVQHDDCEWQPSSAPCSTNRSSNLSPTR